MNWLTEMWKKYRTSPAFVTAYSAFAGAIGKELYTTLQSGQFDWTVKSVQAMLVAGATTAAIALLHLYMPPPTQPVPPAATDAPKP